MITEQERNQWVSRGFKDPLLAYRLHASSAGQRGIGFSLTFDEWWGLWKGHYERRGQGRDDMVMCRNGDEGPYAIGNVRIDTALENARERGRVQLAKAGREEPLTVAQRQKAFKEAQKAAGFVRFEGYITKEQRKAYRELGGDAWLRKAIDRAKVREAGNG